MLILPPKLKTRFEELKGDLHRINLQKRMLRPAKIVPLIAFAFLTKRYAREPGALGDLFRFCSADIRARAERQITGYGRHYHLDLATVNHEQLDSLYENLRSLLTPTTEDPEDLASKNKAIDWERDLVKKGVSDQFIFSPVGAYLNAINRAALDVNFTRLSLGSAWDGSAKTTAAFIADLNRIRDWTDFVTPCGGGPMPPRRRKPEKAKAKLAWVPDFSGAKA